MAYELINLEFLKDLKRKGNKSVIDFCLEMNLLASGFECPFCKLRLTLHIENDELDRYCWSCPVHEGTKNFGYRRSVRFNSWFGRKQSPVIDILICIYMWVTKTAFTIISEELQVSEYTIQNWISRCRDVCVEIVVQENVILGGPGVIVEIYEAKFKKNTSYNPRITGEWVYLVVERGTNKCFVRVKESLDKTVLLNILYERILPGTIIVCYGWNILMAGIFDCYQDKINLERNRNLTFMEGGTIAVESFWSLVQNYVCTCKTDYKFDSAVAEFMWRHFYLWDHQALLTSFLKNISCDRWQEHR